MRISVCMHLNEKTTYNTNKLYVIEDRPPTPVINIDGTAIFFDGKKEVERFKRYLDELLNKLEGE